MSKINKEITEEELMDRYENMLNEVYEPVSICGYSYEQGSALKELDPIAFRQGFLDYIDVEVKDGALIEKDDKYYDSDNNKSIGTGTISITPC